MKISKVVLILSALCAACNGTGTEFGPLSLTEGVCVQRVASEVELPAGNDVRVCSTRVQGASAIVASEAYPFGPLYEDGHNEPLPDGVAYLTFDDGPSEWTFEFLRILREKQVKGTFFINAKNLKGEKGLEGDYLDSRSRKIAFRDVLAQTVDDGHVLGNHTVHHVDLAGLTPEEAAEELDENERLANVALVQAKRPTRVVSLLRPPFGSPWYKGKAILQDVIAARRTTGGIMRNRGINVLWNVDSTDSREWAVGESYTRRPNEVKVDPAVSYDAKVERLKKTVLSNPLVAEHKGVVILMHDTHNATRDALPGIIDGLRAAGYSFATIEEFVESRWHRSSLEMTPGPGHHDACMPDDDRGCIRVGPAGDRICGRVLQAYQAAGGEAMLGAPSGALQMGVGSAAVSQPFEHGALALHPELAPPCNVATVPNGP